MDKAMVKPFLKARKNLKELGIDLQVEDTFRYKSVQEEQYKKSLLPGAKKAGLVAHPDSSYHPKGLAFDLAQIPEMKDPKVSSVLKKLGFIQSRPDDEWWHWSLP
jgi:D-alanyl-D-alanine dipeptidase|tara:strand:- start:999 stop:1313 length:315 start_codon:yes stop_codon:yes gene_type:complete